MISKSLATLKKIKKKFEIIIIDDGCPQSSGKIALKISKKIKNIKVIFHKKNLGYGAALKTGLKNSKYEWIFMIDGDNEYNVNDIFRLIKEARNHDLIITYRYKRKYKNIRKIISWTYNAILRLLFNINYKDISTGSRLLNKKIIKKIHINSNGPFIGAELAIKSKYAKYKIKEIGINTNIRRVGNGSIVTLKNIFLTLKEIIVLFVNINLNIQK